MKLYKLYTTLALVFLLSAPKSFADTTQNANQNTKNNSSTTSKLQNLKNRKIANQFEVVSKEADPFKASVVWSENDVIWRFDFIDDSTLLITLKGGKLKLINIDTNESQEFEGIPSVYSSGQGGLLDVLVDREFSKNHLIYWTFSKSESQPNKYKNSTALTSAELEIQENKVATLKNIKIIKIAENLDSTNLHFGSRIVQDKNNFLFWALGERFSTREKAQKLNSHHGKILRLKRDGSVPQDNPFVNDKTTKPEIWSYGHRNPQGLTYDIKNDLLYEHEHGPQGGDEINIIKPGKNYGWPRITYGEEYGGGFIGPPKKEGMEQPIKYYVPSIAPSGLAIYYGDKFPNWNGDLFLGALAGRHINHVIMKKGVPVDEKRYLIGERYRCVKISPDGYIFVSTDSGRIIKIEPK